MADIESFDVNEWRMNHQPPSYFSVWLTWFDLGFRLVAQELGDVMATLDDLAAKEAAVLAAVNSLVAKVNDLEAQLASAPAAGTLSSAQQATVDSTDAGLQSALDAANAVLNPAPAPSPAPAPADPSAPTA